MAAKGRFFISTMKDENTEGAGAAASSGNANEKQQWQQAETTDSTPSPVGSNYTTASESGNNMEVAMATSTVHSGHDQPATQQSQVSDSSLSAASAEVAELQQPTQTQLLQQQLEQMHSLAQQQQDKNASMKSQPTGVPQAAALQAAAMAQLLPASGHTYNTVSGSAPAQQIEHQQLQQPATEQQQLQQHISQQQQHLLLQQQSATHSLPPVSPSTQRHNGQPEQAAQRTGFSLQEQEVEFIYILLLLILVCKC